jgi:hypothetical protein
MMRGVVDMLREADKPAGSAEWQTFRENIARPKDLSSSETGLRLSEQLQSLFNLIDGANDAPTQAMLNLLTALQGEYLSAADKFKSLKR